MYQSQLLALAPGEFVFSSHFLAYFFNEFLFEIFGPEKAQSNELNSIEFYWDREALNLHCMMNEARRKKEVKHDREHWGT